MLSRIALTVATASVLAFAAPAAAQMNKEKCAEAVADVQDMQKAGGIGAKTEAQVKELIEVAMHLCDQGNFQYADSVLRVVRTMMASE